jgi:PAS domain S-box-containing protein
MSDGLFVRANNAICHMLGYTEEEFCQKTISNITHPEDLQNDLEHTLKMVRGEISMFCIEKRLLKKNGFPVWVRLTAVSVARDPSGQATFGMAVCEDISEIKQTQEALKESEERFKILADSAPVTIFVTDQLGNTTYVNTSWSTYTGLSFENSLGDGWKAALHPDDMVNYTNAFFTALENRQHFRKEVRIRQSNGSFGWMLTTGVPRYMPNGLFLGYIGTGIDITERKITELSLEHAKWLAEEANRKKSEFLFQVSQELKTPLNSIIGFSGMLEAGFTGELTLQQKELVNHINSSSHHLLVQINDLVNISNIESLSVPLAQ